MTCLFWILYFILGATIESPEAGAVWFLVLIYLMFFGGTAEKA